MTLRRRTAAGSVVLAGLLLAAGCGSPDVRASRDLADEVKVDGYRRASDYTKGNTARVSFVGPAGVNLETAVSVSGWSAGPAPGGFSDKIPFQWVLNGSARSGDRDCAVVVEKLRRGNEQLARGLSSQEMQDLTAGQLDYVNVSFICNPG
ncbi:hypothetical protein ACFY36_15160 [Actinoplanes sp. NPDC000266]